MNDRELRMYVCIVATLLAIAWVMGTILDFPLGPWPTVLAQWVLFVLAWATMLFWKWFWEV